MLDPEQLSSLLSLMPALIALGTVSGILAGLLGIGGGVVLVPGLIIVFTALGFEGDTMMHLAIGTSLAIIIPTGLSSFYAHYKKKSADLELVKRIGGGIVLGVIIGTVIASALSGLGLKIVFACAIAVLAGLMVWSTLRSAPSNSNAESKHSITTLTGNLAGIGIGSISSLIGIGGATLSVPFMSLNNVVIHRAIGTATALGLIISIPAALGFVIIGWDNTATLPPFSIGYVNALAWLCIVPSSVLAAPLGAKLAHKLPVKTLKLGFACFMILISVKLWIELIPLL